MFRVSSLEALLRYFCFYLIRHVVASVNVRITEHCLFSEHCNFFC